MTLNEYRALQKKHHICRGCGTQDAYTLSGRTYCAECAAKCAELKSKERAKDNGKKNAENCKKWRDKNISEHRCSRCGKKLFADYAYKTCPTCRAITKNNIENRRRKKGILPWDMRCNGERCFQCNKRPAIKGKHLCKECYEKKLSYCMQNLKLAND